MADCKRKEIPFDKLPWDITKKLKEILIIDNKLLDDWTDLAGILGLGIKEVGRIKAECKLMSLNPVELLLNYYSRQPDSTIEKFLEILNQLKIQKDLEDIKEKIKVFMENERRKPPVENDETESEIKVSYNEQPIFFRPSYPIQFLHGNSKYPIGIFNPLNDTFQDFGYSNNNFYHGHRTLQRELLKGELISKGPDSENNQSLRSSNSSKSLNSISTDLTNNLETSCISNCPRQFNQGVNILPSDQLPRVISIDKIQNTEQRDSSIRPHIKISSISRLTPTANPEHVQSSLLFLNPDPRRKVLIVYANDIEERVKQLAKFFRQEKYHLKVTLITDYSEEMSHNLWKWVADNIKWADIIINPISPQYKLDVDSHNITDDSNLLLRYIADQLQNQYFNNGCKHIKARVILFKPEYKKYIPEFLKSTIPFDYKKEWRQFCTMVIGPNLNNQSCI